MDQEKSLIKKYLAGKTSESENDFVESWINQLGEEKDISNEDLLKMMNSLDEKMGVPTRRKVINYKRIISIAASLLIFMIAGYVIYNKSFEKEVYTVESFKAPSKENAIIVLENNEEYDLNNLKAGDTIHTQNYHVTRLDNGEIRYVMDHKSTQLVYNTIRTKVGGTANVVLSDGTQVWLNVNSELRYPVEFDTEKREVFLKGEGYFEVEKQVSQGNSIPFYVRSENHSISVLGTKFNVNLNNGFETALLEGKVAVGKGDERVDASNIPYNGTILPNQVYLNGQIFQVDKIENYIDWKDGYFNLYGLNIKVLSKKLSDWYGVKINVDPKLEESELVGRISRTKDLNEVLEIISEAIPMNYHVKAGELFLEKQATKK